MTVGTPDANGAGASSTGFVRISVSSTSPGQAAISADITDVRCKAGTSACGNANSTGGPDYTGELQSNATIRITDHYNSVSAGGGTDPATVRDVPFPVNLVCSNTAKHCDRRQLHASREASRSRSSPTPPIPPGPSWRSPN